MGCISQPKEDKGSGSQWPLAFGAGPVFWLVGEGGEVSERGVSKAGRSVAEQRTQIGGWGGRARAWDRVRSGADGLSRYRRRLVVGWACAVARNVRSRGLVFVFVFFFPPRALAGSGLSLARLAAAVFVSRRGCSPNHHHHHPASPCQRPA